MLAKKIFKEVPDFKLFNNTKQYLSYRKLATMQKAERIQALEKSGNKEKFSEQILNNLKNIDKPDQYNMLKGVIELDNIIGSVLGLAIFAPQVRHLIVHPVLELLGLEEKNPHKEEADD